MLRRLQMLLVLCSLASPAVAGTLTLGIHGGSSVPNLRDNGGNEFSSGWSSRFAPFFGVTACEDLTGSFSAQAEVNVAPHVGKRDGLQALSADPTQLGAPANDGKNSTGNLVIALGYAMRPGAR